MKTQILKYLADTFGLEGNDAEELFVSYVDTVSDNFAKFTPDQSVDDFKRIAIAAHSIKGCALNCGHIEMSEVARAVEFAAKASNLQEIRENAKKVESIAEALKAEL